MVNILGNTSETQRRTPNAAQAKILDLTRQLAEAKDRAERAEADAAALAGFIQTRVGASVWDHNDVMTILQELTVGLCQNMLAALSRAEARNLSPGYVMFREILVTRFETARAKVLDQIGHEGERGAISNPEYVSDRMKQDVRNVVRLRPAA